MSGCVPALAAIVVPPRAPVQVASGTICPGSSAVWLGRFLEPPTPPPDKVL